VISTPFRNTVGNGQQSLLVLAALTLALFAKRTAGQALGTAVAITKYSFAPALLVLQVFRRRFRALVVTAIATAVAFLAFWVIVGGGGSDVLVGPLRVGRKSEAPGVADVMTLVGFHGTSSNGSVAAAVGIGITLLLMLLSHRNRHEWRALADLSLVAIVSLVSFKHLPYDFVVLLPVLVLATRYPRASRWIVYAVVGWFFFGLRVVLSLGVNYDRQPLVLADFVLVLIAYVILVREESRASLPQSSNGRKAKRRRVELPATAG
jgi:hypothetical protein